MAEFAQYLIGGLVVGSIYGLIGIGYTAIGRAGADREKIRDALEELRGHLGVTAVYSCSPTDHFGAHEDSVVMLQVRSGAFELAK